ncbi:dystrophia myotonica WD repeat-containing protein [Hydra vulgaris]|uniref:Dystrophia myotonica WD repeat-containing protein n=1 Tax=Hydra vulgaris TaxID=6087 RepID=A0ABM4CJE4_HYDVU
MAASAAVKAQHNSEVKTQFCTKEGCYKSLKFSDYSRPARLANNASNNIPVKLSFVTLKGVPEGDCEDKIAFNVGRDMYFYNFRGTKKAPDLNEPIDRRTYKGPQPTCHDINMITRTPTSIELIIGFTAGQIQLVDPLKRECRKCFNDERLIEKGAVTCVKWVPGSESKFLVSYNNPNIYMYDKNLPSIDIEPQLQMIKKGSGYVVNIMKNRPECNPLCRWSVGQGGINEICFSPDCKHLAVVSQDGYLRVFDFEKQELISSMRSYFGGVLCVCWSPDGRYIVTGGEDDLITVWSCHEQQVIARGEGHRSWVNVVSFDAYTTQVKDQMSLNSDDEDYPKNSCNHINNVRKNETIVSYRVGSVGDDTQLLLWDISEDILKPERIRTRSNRGSTLATIQPVLSYSSQTMKVGSHTKNFKNPIVDSQTTNKYTTYKRHNSQPEPPKLTIDRDDLILGSKICPRMNECKKIEPLLAKKIAYDRLSALVFREDCIVTGTYDGYVHVWARPNGADALDVGTLIQ